MLSAETRTIVKATVPVLEQYGTTITETFYKNMLSEHEELLNIFNKINQKKGAQPTALATTVIAAAKNIDDLSVLIGHVNQIGHKHRALQVKPEHYPIVGHYLLRAIKEVLGDAATPEILQAWREAYEEIANFFITVEKKMYDEAAWDGWKPFTVVKKEKVASDVYEFTMKPEADSGIDLKQLSITAETSENNPMGLVSEFLHKDVNVGDKLKLSAPAGDFALDEKLIEQNEIPIVLLASGVGVTPLLAMLETQVQRNPKRPVYWIQSSHDVSTQAFVSHVDELLGKCAKVTKHIVHSKVNGRIDDNFLKANIPNHADVYISGSLEFMQAMIDHLKLLEHKDDKIHYEPFGPKMATLR